MYNFPSLFYVRLLKNTKNINRYIEKWEKNKFPILFITGLAGSGKTCYAQQLAKKYNSELLSLDSLKYYQNASEINKKLVNEFTLLYPEITSYINSKWTSISSDNELDKLYSHYSQLFTEYIIYKAFKENRRYIIEGIHIFMRLSQELTSDVPLIILGTSCIHSIYRKFKREYLSGENEYRKTCLKDILKDLFFYEFKQLFVLNEYIYSLPETCV